MRGPRETIAAACGFEPTEGPLLDYLEAQVRRALRVVKLGERGAVWLLAMGQTLTYAGVYYSFPALLPALEAGDGVVEGGSLAAGPTLAFLVMAVLTPFTGRLVDRGWGGEMLIWLPVAAAAGVAVLAVVTSPWQWMAVWLVIGVTQAGMLYESCFSFLTRRLGDRGAGGDHAGHAGGGVFGDDDLSAWGISLACGLAGRGRGWPLRW